MTAPAAAADTWDGIHVSLPCTASTDTSPSRNAAMRARTPASGPLAAVARAVPICNLHSVHEREAICHNRRREGQRDHQLEC